LALRREQRKQFFFEKKNQKTFTSLGGAYPGTAEPNPQTFFAAFFQKRSPSVASLTVMP
jgi:hypothetical protein